MTNKPHSCNDPNCPAPSHDYPDGVEPAPSPQGPAPTPPARLEELLTGIRERRANLGAHNCAGFDCATCEPSRDVEELDEVIDMVTGRNVE